MRTSKHNTSYPPHTDLSIRQARAVQVGLRGSRGHRHSLADRLKARTLITPDCWLIQGCRVGSMGYGQITRDNGERIFAHRAAWELANGPIPDGLKVCHRCDNPRCVNVDHLFLGTQAENILDSIRKGRYNVFGHQKLNAEQVLEIRSRAAAGVPQRVLGAKFGVARNTISGIVNRATWAHLDPPDGAAA